MKRKRRLLTALLAVWLCQSPAGAAEDTAVRRLIEDITPGHERAFVIETIPAPAGENVMEVEARDGKIVLRGDGPLSQAVAFNWYLKHEAFVDVSWYADDPVNPPEQLPLPRKKVRQTTRIKDRFFLNYCTFGYTLPFWHWRDWERLIDWMALNGISLPLAQNGNEYVWQKVWRDYGLSDAEIRAFFTGPAYLPWHRMVNIDHWDGPLPQGFIDGQHDLQQRILARERELGMKPVLCAFAGHVPEALHARQPNLQLEKIPQPWSGFSSNYGCWFLNPMDARFKEIQVRFLREQQREYGTSHYYGTDPFNEIKPPSWDPAYLAGVARAIYGGMAQVDPQAVWLQMAWTFRQRTDWTDKRLSAMIGAVPPGRMELIDYYCEDRELFRETRSFYGAPFIWDYLGNFGGNSDLAGPINRINGRLAMAMNDPNLTNFIGVGATLEGLNNPVVYELLFDRVWAGTNLDLAEWVRHEARARAGGADAKVEQAWDILRTKVLVDFVNPVHGRGAILQSSEPALRGAAYPSAAIPYGNADLVRAWGLLLQARPAARTSSAYQRDLVDVTRQALGNMSLTLRDRMAAAKDQTNAAAFQLSAAQFIELGRDLDAFLGTRSEFMLGKWIDDAKLWAANPEERAYYERDARSIVTIWGGHLTDYASRQWNGLIRDYYLPRWQGLIDAVRKELDGGERVDRVALQRQWRIHDLKFATTSDSRYSARPSGDFFAASRALFQKYEPLAATQPAVPGQIGPPTRFSRASLNKGE